MSDFRNQSTTTEKSEAEASGEGEAGSSSSGPQKPEGGARSSLWSRAARFWRMSGASSLRKDLAEALMTEGEGGETAFLPGERAMLHNILRFREVRVEDVMVPRADIEAVDQSITVAELMVFFEDSGRSRMPVYCESLDDPRGMVHIRDLLAYVTRQARNKRRNGTRNGNGNGNGAGTEKAGRTPKADFDLGRVDLSKTVAEAGIIRNVLFVPPSMLAADLMARMQADRTQMALVIDEYGGTDGLASLEDIVEMVVGDIEDEHDDEEAMITQVNDDVSIADARVELEELAEAIGPDFDIRDQLEDADTLGGLIFASLGRIPARGEVVQAVPGFEFHVLDADPRRVKRVRVTRKRAHAARRRERRPEGEGADPAAGPEKPSDPPPAKTGTQ
ncbi:hemolysin family protein [Shinella daejeonensis]|uniref:transporter associated domain-containing protein n=1 Tax=Shinella daejeonensis TaxID=659017 RepID=UPI0020C77DB1|nr:hemolysin family protein [Shinella daejeonensis]MCP8897288.1 hemolysin family protein [Shinella daejeonensis]